jgi:hypothetical protein
MTRFTDNLWRDLAEEHGPALALADRPEPGPAHLLRRPRLLAGSTLGLAAAGAAIVLGLGAATSTPAFAIATNPDGSVTVTMNHGDDIVAVNDKLTSMGIHEQIIIRMAQGPAPASGPVACTPAPGTSNLPGPPLKVLVGKNGTDFIPAGATVGNTGEGTWHLGACHVNTPGDTGNTGI